MKKVLIVTDIDFWRGGAGHRSRLYRLIDYLSPKVLLTIVYTRKFESADRRLIEAASLRFSLVLLNEAGDLERNAMGSMVREIAEINDYDICIIEYIHNSYFLNFIPSNVTTILDAHDIVSERGESLSNIPDSPCLKVAVEAELKLYRYYDYIMLICEPDFCKISKFIPIEKLLLVPHFCPVVPKVTRPEVTTIGFVGSEYIANQDGLLHFVSTSWPVLRKTRDVQLSIFGNICKTFVPDKTDNRVKIEGFVPDMRKMYGQIDIAINPVRFGAGIKIKSIEALAHETPLVTTAHGARGLERGYNKAFLVAEDSRSFSKHVVRLIDDYSYRKTVARHGREFVEKQFSQASCYKPLLSVIYKN